MRPESITVKLTGKVGDDIVYPEQENTEQTTYATIEVKESDNWAFSFTNLPEFDSDGNKITYSITENKVEKYQGEVTGDAENGFTITNTHTPETIGITVTKSWVDGNDKDGLRPEKLTIKLYANGNDLNKPLVLTAPKDNLSSNTWTGTFEDLPKYNNGQEIVYTIKEELPEKLKDLYTPSNGKNEAGKDDPYHLVNTHTPKPVTISVTKVWEDEGNRYNHPEKVTVKLTGKVGDDIVYPLTEEETKNATMEVTEKNNWTGKFENLPEYYKGSIITYSIDEDDVKDYSKEITGSVTGGFTITNTYAPETQDITVTKKWDDKSNQDGKRPESITINLYDGINEEPVDTQIIETPEGNPNTWTYTFENQPVYANGEEIKYSIEEVLPEGYEDIYEPIPGDGYTITNKHTPATVSYIVEKIWDDSDNNDGIRPDYITVRLYRNEEKTAIDTQKITKENNWTYTFTDLPKYAAGKEITYTIVEDEVMGYTPSKDEAINEKDPNETKVTFTNTHQKETKDITVTKTWKDNNNQDGIRPESIIVRVFDANGELVRTKTIEAPEGNPNTWTYTFTGLDKYLKGVEIVYTIQEERVLGYETKIEGYNIINTHTPETTEYKVTKIWEDSDNNDGIRPSKVKVNLKANGVVIKTEYLTEKDNWEYTFTDLPKFSNGDEIVYTITEDEVEGYESDIEENTLNKDDIDTPGAVITNTHEKEQAEIVINKVWDDENDKREERPESIRVNIYDDQNELVETVVITEEDDWTLAIEGLDKYRNGKEIKYTLKEEKVENYVTFYDGYTITNAYQSKGEITPPNTGINVTTKNNLYLELIALVTSALGIILGFKKREN